MGMPEFTRKRRFSGGHSPRLHRTFWPPTGYRLFQKGHRHLPFTAKPLHFAHSPHRAFFGRNPTSFIVGYAQSGLREGATMTTAQFVGVGTAGGVIDLQDLKPQGDDCVDNLNLSTLGPYGDTLITYTWIDYGSDGGAYWTEDGDTKAVGVTFQPSEAFWLQASSDQQSLQSSGEVSKEDITIQLREGATMVGNSTPVEVDLQDILPSGDDCVDNLNLSILGPYGDTLITYTWIDYGSEGGAYWTEDGDTKATGVKIQPGAGVWLQASSTEQYVTFPGVEL